MTSCGRRSLGIVAETELTISAEVSTRGGDKHKLLELSSFKFKPYDLYKGYNPRCVNTLAF